MKPTSTLESVETPDLDAHAVDAIQAGDRERYRELVERHARRVYAVAWSRLGDAHLAEEAAQEAFIKGYRHLEYLSQGRKFATWITAIARHAAINLGLRHRRELEKRERWALEPADPATESTPPDGGPAGRFTAETLRGSLAKLPPVHRECLVLFYLEEKGISEAAAALSISEGTFRTRLHRARAALREQLERELERSLSELRPPGHFVHGVMALLPGTATTPIAGAGLLGGLTSWASGLAAKLPFASLLPLVSMVAGFIPAILVHRWISREEQGNFRDPDGFRAQQHRNWVRRFGWTLPAQCVGVFAVQWALTQFAGPRGASLGIAVLMSFLILSALSTNRLLGSPAARLNTLALFLFALGFWVTGLGILPLLTLGWFSAAAFIPMAFAVRQYSPRMDLSLFLRAHNGLLRENTEPSPGRRRVTRPEQHALARFLGQRQLVMDYTWRGDDLHLRLAGVGFDLAVPMPAVLWNRASVLTLRADGSVRADLGARDARALGIQDPATAAANENRVEQAIGEAWTALLAQGPAAAEDWIGQHSESELFKVAPRHSRAGRWRLRVIYIAIGLMVLSQIMLWRAALHSAQLSVPGMSLQAVDATSRDLAATLARLATTTHPIPGQTNFAPNDPWITFHTLLHTGAILPSPESLGEAWPVVRSALWTTLVPTNTPPQARRDLLLSALALNPSAQRALLAGWITMDELKEQGVDREALRQWWLNIAPSLGDHLTGVPRVQAANVDDPTFDVTRLALRLQTLRAFDLLDVIDAEPIVTLLRAHQVLPGNALSELRPLPDRAGMNGLFWIGVQGPLRDTHGVLVVLSTLGALESIDRTACIEGVLHLHRGRGLFSPVQYRPGQYISGDAGDTWAAFESLRLLDGLDRVGDLGSWQFRPLASTGRTSDGSARVLTTWEIEAWSMKEARDRYLKP